MFRDLPRYEDQRRTMMPWCPSVPAHWRMSRNKLVMAAKRKMVGAQSSEYDLLSLTKAGVISRDISTGKGKIPASFDTYQMIESGDLIMCLFDVDETPRTVGRARKRGMITGAYDRFVVADNVLAEYVKWFYLSVDDVKGFRPLYRGLRKTVPLDKFMASQFPLPSPAEQTAIVKYLAHANARIDKAIAAKRRLISLLEEQHRALNMEILEGCAGAEESSDLWPKKRLKWVTRLQRGYDLSAEAREPGPFPVISSGGTIATHRESRAAGPGVVIGRYGSTGAVFFVETSFWPHNTALFVTNFYGNDPRWCYWLLRSIDKTIYAEKSAVPGVDRKDLYEIEVTVPPISEQRRMVRLIEQNHWELESLVSRCRDEISLLQEFRTRLVADVVTGQVDVRAIAATLPDASEPIDNAFAELDDDLEEALVGSEA
ncbi:restriction endonuclease subunit S [Pseudarthrobacter cellobiosi]|uniref:restriction endonuclease subunit S n=1 Tax=Pseudarthrobacter cellobiosi TaxID=2953654 RepID=UPI00208FB62D|nr:restriction endonuclease subunit S [Pseudarthrobacter sp. HLT1-5]MCO4253893.1 restriction endonuclease subunit S [Pseudarthrobacter sp. HLT1-5]